MHQYTCLLLWLLFGLATTMQSKLVACPDEENSFHCGGATTQGEYQCIASDKKCNGISECSNGADESVAICGCPQGEFQCDNSTCINNAQRCDLQRDCDNGRDEENCETYICPDSFQKCANHFCVHSSLFCNFINDCLDNSDEENCYRRPCFYSEWRCLNENCINSANLCDGRDDCLDNSDEVNCTQHVQCLNGLYVPDYQKCNGFVDCPHDMNDELNCPCKQSQFTCNNTRCIDQANVCDGTCDCGTECDDERDCEEAVCSMGKFICAQHVTHTQLRCLRVSAVCDGVSQCWDGPTGFDEKFCDHTPRECSDSPTERQGLCKWCLNSQGNDTQSACTGFISHQPTNKCQPDEFMCGDGSCIPSAYRCDTTVHCHGDAWDELDCDEWECRAGQKQCRSGQCVPASHWCDFHKHCSDSSDELDCGVRPTCAADEFRCASGQCIPGNMTCIYLGQEEIVQGCVDKSHLLTCAEHECGPGYLKCNNSYCVPDSFKCNQNYECITFTDESDCGYDCPYPGKECWCDDNEMFCEERQLTYIPDTTQEGGLTVYQLGGNNIGGNFTKFALLEHAKVSLLNLTDNNIQTLQPGTFSPMFRLRTLILSDNRITKLLNGSFEGLTKLKSLFLYSNHISAIEPGTFTGLQSLTNLNLSHQSIRKLQRNTFIGLKSLYILLLNNNDLEFIENGAFNDMPVLKQLDLSHNSPVLIIQEYVFNGLLHLNELTTDQFRFCCLAPFVEMCTPEPDEFSSCEDLMSNILLRISIWVLGILSLLGNALVIAWRVYDKRDSKVHSFLISHLAIADMMMGLYLLIIASVDSYYRGRYIAYDIDWRTSQLCHFAGFLSTFSSELSVFTLTVITMDRFVTIIFPFHFNRMGIGSARLVMAAMWGLSVFVSALPLCGIPYFMDYYSRSGVCLALHITDDRPNGWQYSVFVFLVLNLVSFSVIFIAYVWMFVVAKQTRAAVPRNGVQNGSDMAMARRMTLIVSTDFFCWVPIIIMGFSSLGGAKIPPEVYAWVAVFVLPLNSAINPILYTISTATFLKQARRRVFKVRKSFISSLAPVPDTLVYVASEERISLQEGLKQNYRPSQTSSRGASSRSGVPTANNDYRRLVARNTNRNTSSKGNGPSTLSTRQSQIYTENV